MLTATLSSCMDHHPPQPPPALCTLQLALWEKYNCLSSQYATSSGDIFGWGNGPDSRCMPVTWLFETQVRCQRKRLPSCRVCTQTFALLQGCRAAGLQGCRAAAHHSTCFSLLQALNGIQYQFPDSANRAGWKDAVCYDTSCTAAGLLQLNIAGSKASGCCCAGQRRAAGF